jgi:hypothetical protein
VLVLPLLGYMYLSAARLLTMLVVVADETLGGSPSARDRKEVVVWVI